jgi:hypothetical protein
LIMRASLFVVGACFGIGLALTEKAEASVYAWTGAAEIVGAISGPASVSFQLTSFAPGFAFTPSAYFAWSYNVYSYDTEGQLFSGGGYGVTVYAGGNVTGSPPDATYATVINFSAGGVGILDNARTLKGFLAFEHGFASIYGGGYSVGIVLPDGLSVAGEEPITSAVPEPSTWAMLLIGFAGIGFAAIRRRRLAIG